MTRTWGYPTTAAIVGAVVLRTMPTLATIKLSRRWGTRICGLLGDGGGDEGLGFGLDLFEVVGAVEGFGVDLVDVFGAGGAGGEPAVFGGDFEAADGGLVAGGFGKDGGDGFAG